MFKNIKTQVAVGLILASIGGLCPLQAMENNQEQNQDMGIDQGRDYESDLELAIAMNLDADNNPQAMEVCHNNSSSNFPSNSQLVQNTEKYNVDVGALCTYSGNLPISDVWYIIISMAGFDDTFSNDLTAKFAQVCRGLRDIIEKKYNEKELLWKTYYRVGNLQYQLIKTMKVLYCPDPQSDKDMITLKIPAFVNPLKYEFDLSMCGDAGKYICISTEMSMEITPKNKDKIEIWVTPLLTTSIFFTWGNWTYEDRQSHNEHYDYLTRSVVPVLTNNDCQTLFNHARHNPNPSHLVDYPKSHINHLQNFHFYFDINPESHVNHKESYDLHFGKNIKSYLDPLQKSDYYLDQNKDC